MPGRDSSPHMRRPVTRRIKNGTFGRLSLAALGLVLASSVAPGALAQTMEAALSRAYSGNPTLNAQRASLRATNENVPQALSGYRPRVTASADIGASITDANVPGGRTSTTRLAPRGGGVQIDQNIFDGGKTRKAWEQERRDRIVGKRSISVKLSGLKITVNGNKATAQFRQDYKADSLSVSSGKRLELVRAGGKWVIAKESTGS